MPIQLISGALAAWRHAVSPCGTTRRRTGAASMRGAPRHSLLYVAAISRHPRRHAKHRVGCMQHAYA